MTERNVAHATADASGSTNTDLKGGAVTFAGTTSSAPPTAWSHGDFLPPPCNPKTGSKILAAPGHSILKACGEAGETHGYFLQVYKNLKERTKFLINDYYVAGKIHVFSNTSQSYDFPKPVCDLIEGEADNPSTGSYANGCGNMCVMGKSWPSDDHVIITINAGTCEREVAYVRGAWVRAVSASWIMVMDELRVNKGVRMPAVQGNIAELRGGNFTDKPPCAELGDAYVKELDRIINPPSKIWDKPDFKKLTVADCVKGNPKAGTACPILHARDALEDMYVAAMACAQMTYGMGKFAQFVVRGSTAQGNNGSGANAADMVPTVFSQTFDEVASDLNKIAVDRANYVIDHDIDDCGDAECAVNHGFDTAVSQYKATWVARIKPKIEAGGATEYLWGKDATKCTHNCAARIPAHKTTETWQN